MNAAQLKASILQQAIEGKLVSQLPEEGVVEQIGDAPTEVPFEIPLSWKWVTLEKCVFINPKITPRDDDIQATFLPMAAVSAGFVNRYSIEDKRSWGKIKNGFSRFENNDVLMAKITPCFQNRKSCIVTNLENGVGAGSTEFSVLRTKTVVTPDYILWFLKSKYFIDYGISKLKGTAGQQRVGTPSLKECLIPLPPLAEQKRIVAKIEELMPLVEEYGKAYDKLQELNDELPGKLKASILQEAIQGKLVPQLHEDGVVEQIGNAPEEAPFDIPNSWKWYTLGNLIEYGNCKQVAGKDITSTTWVLDLEDIEKNTGKIIEKKRNVKSTSNKNVFEEGYVLYSKLRPYLNKVVIADETGVCTTEIIPINVKTAKVPLLPHYLQFCLMSPSFLNYANRCSYGVKMPRLGTNDAKAAYIPVPPLAEQKRIVAKLDTLLEQVDLMTK